VRGQPARLAISRQSRPIEHGSKPAHLAQACAGQGAMIAAFEAGDRAGLVELCRDQPGPSRDASIAAVEPRQGRDQAR